MLISTQKYQQPEEEEEEKNTLAGVEPKYHNELINSVHIIIDADIQKWFHANSCVFSPKILSHVSY